MEENVDLLLRMSEKNLEEQEEEDPEEDPEEEEEEEEDPEEESAEKGENTLDKETDLSPQQFDFTDVFSTHEVFYSRDAFLAWARNLGKEHGFVVVIKNSEIGSSGRKPRIRLGCERSGKYRRFKRHSNAEKKNRKSSGTKKCDCPFEIHGIKLSQDDDWGVKVACGLHNHSLTEQPVGHSYAGRLSSEERKILFEMTKNSVKPKSILQTLKSQDKNNASTMKTIYNARQRYKQVVEQAEKSQMQQFMNQLIKYKYVTWHRMNESTKCVKDLFWAHPTAVDLLHTFPSVLIVDSSYKTNDCRLPSLEIVGVTSTNLTFSAAFVYMEAKCKGSYIWAMEKLRSLMPLDRLPAVIVTERDLIFMTAIHVVFPTTTNLLCRWHISEDVLTKCKELFERREKCEAFMSAWSVVVFSSNKDEYRRHLSSLETDYRTYPEVIQYVTDTWLIPYQEKFVAAWTDRLMHLGNVTTNRAEGAHVKLKKHFESSQGDFGSAWDVINSLIELQHTEIKASFQKGLISVVKHNFNAPLFEELQGLVSKVAVDMILMEAKRANQVGIDKSACGCVNRSAYGLPCAHEIAELIRDGRPIQQDFVHPHWKKLELMKATINEVSSELTIAPELENILRHFETCDTAGKLDLKRKLGELANPSTISMFPPLEEPMEKSCPALILDAPTHFESAHGDTSPSAANSVKVTKRRRKHIDCFPQEIHKYIHNIVDVQVDGHCGFRCVAELLGMGSDGWADVRKDLIKELQSFRDFYVSFYGSSKRVDDLLSSLSYLDTCAPLDKWMTLPDMGCLVSSRYDVVLVHLSARQCLTFLPLRSTPPAALQHKLIVIGLVNDRHFVQVLMDPLSPIPPIACKWRTHRLECATGWETPYVARIDTFKSLFVGNSDVAMQETIDVDEA